MKLFVVGFACCAVVGCGQASGPAQPLDGRWVESVGFSHASPSSLTIAQRGTAVQGTGVGFGVDAPMDFAVDGSAALPAVTLHFVFLGSGVGASWSGILTSDDRLVGRIVSDSATGSVGDSITYTRP